MAKAAFENYGNKPAPDLRFEDGKISPFVETSGGPVDPYGDTEKKEKDSIDMNAGEAFNKKDYTKVEACGTDYPKKGNSGQRSDNSGDHFSVGSVDPSGNDAGKGKSGQSSKRS